MLSRRDPFREFDELRRTMDRWFEDTLANPTTGFQPNVDISMDVFENEDEYVVKAAIPGLNPDDLDITYTDRTLTIRGEVKGDKDTNNEKTRYHMRERWFGNFSRSIVLPTNIQADAIKADFDAGVLTLHLPKAEEVKPKRIPVNAGGKMIEGSSRDSKNIKK